MLGGGTAVTGSINNPETPVLEQELETSVLLGMLLPSCPRS